MESKTEQWKLIPGFDNMYLASSEGRIKSIRFGRERILKLHPKNNGYLKVNISENGKPYTRLVHRLVASAFFGEISKDITVNHIDFNKENNSIENLELVTHKDNVRHSFYHKRRNEGYKKGSNNGRSKLNEHDVDYIRGLHLPISDIAKMMGVSTTVIYGIRNYKTWKHV